MGDPTETDRFSSTVRATVRYFNGNLLYGAKVYELDPLVIDTLKVAANTEWNRVEPAIFGRLLEHALVPSERGKLGAHFTPKPFVERLVDATMMDVLRPEWLAVEARARAFADAGDQAAGRAELEVFHAWLTEIRVLDPACGTGNFLYVSMERLMVLEGEVVELIVELGGEARLKVGPQQFLGIELNPRAAVIAELVLWIGWLRRRIENDPHPIEDPVLHPIKAINDDDHGGRDAILMRGEHGEPLPLPARAWPKADFIVGNPPFIGGKDIREELGGEYAKALWTANPDVPASADLVMQWWDRAAGVLLAEGSRLRRFGFVTTNSIRQEFSRRVIARWLAPPPLASPPPPPEGEDWSSPSGGGARRAERERALSLVYAVPDHPWTKQRVKAAEGARAREGEEKRGEPAAVRIAMTVAERGVREGWLVEVVSEAGLETDTPVIDVRPSEGRINADLSIGADVTRAVALRANAELASPGVKLHGDGFIVTRADAAALGLGTVPGLEAHIREYRNGRDLTGNPRDVLVIDLFGLSEKAVRRRFPNLMGHLLQSVKPVREAQAVKSATADALDYAAKYWIMGKPRPDLRQALAGLTRYIVTVETAKFRVFQFLDASILPDNRLVCFALEDAFLLGVLSSRHHVTWSLRAGGTLEDRPVYTKSLCFDPFPFPDPTPARRAAIAELAEELDAHRKAAIAARTGRTLTGLYNAATAIRARAPLTPEQAADERDGAPAAIVARLHEQLDAEVAGASGWPAVLAPKLIVDRLVRLNAERDAEEAAGQIRWLRPEYQAAR